MTDPPEVASLFKFGKLDRIHLFIRVNDDTFHLECNCGKFELYLNSIQMRTIFK
jgi:hypothetical protein